MLNPEAWGAREAGRHVLVTGSHRSGTTWVGKSIALNPRVAYVHEPFHGGNPNALVGLRPNHWFEYAPGSSRKEELGRRFDDLFAASPVRRASREARLMGLGVGKTPRRFFEYLIEGSRRDRLLLKDPLALLSAGWLYERYGLQVVCMIRHPLSFVGSLKKAGWTFGFENLYEQKELMRDVLFPFEEEIRHACGRPWDLAEGGGLLWNVLHFVILGYRERYPSWAFVRYEDLAREPLAGFRHLYEVLDLRISEEIEAEIEAYTSVDNPTESEATEYRPRDARKGLENWKKRLSPEEAQRVREKTRDLTASFYGDSN